MVMVTRRIQQIERFGTFAGRASNVVVYNFDGASVWSGIVFLSFAVLGGVSLLFAFGQFFTLVIIVFIYWLIH